MKQPPSDATRVSPDRLQTWIENVARDAGLTDAKATLLARLLVENDLRGVFSHGSALMLRYTREIRRGDLHAKAETRCIKETPTSLLMDGDGGLGYFPAHEGTLRLREKVEQAGMAAMVTRNHGHIGAAGIYTRLTLPHDFIAFMTSGVQLNLKPGDLMYEAAGKSPMSFSAPGCDEESLVFDCGVTHDFQGEAPPHRDAIAALAPGVALRAIGFGAICQAWGGLLSGLPADGERAQHPYSAANQGAMLFACKISLFIDPDVFKREIDDYVRQTRDKLIPIPDTEGVFLPGGVEAEHGRSYRRDGIPLSDWHRDTLQTTAAETGISLPFD